ncbi:hydrolase [Methylobacter sp. sgz302048]|uniref:hydrolase n=1 Tax=Methylobacter sp. sgz302048 TaxID=3455945 RepID=UPI003F9FF1E1
MNTHSNLLLAENSLLIVVDLQPRLSAAMPGPDAELMTVNAGKLVEAAGLLDIPVLVTEQYPKGLGPTAASVIEKLPETAQVFEKTGFSCCAAEGFTQALQDSRRKQIILVGQETHVCVLQTALELLHEGYQVHVAMDAVCSRKSEHKHYALQRMQHQGAIITNYESVLFEWLRDSTHPYFKHLSGFLR